MHRNPTPQSFTPEHLPVPTNTAHQCPKCTADLILYRDPRDNQPLLLTCKSCDWTRKFTRVPIRLKGTSP